MIKMMMHSTNRLDNIGWSDMQTILLRDIMSIENLEAQRDLKKMLVGLTKIATELSKAEVTERRTPGAPGRRCNELEKELLERHKYIQKMIMLARLQFT